MTHMQQRRMKNAKKIFEEIKRHYKIMGKMPCGYVINGVNFAVSKWDDFRVDDEAIVFKAKPLVGTMPSILVIDHYRFNSIFTY